MRSMIIALSLALAISPVPAQDAPKVMPGMMLRDAKGARLGAVDRVRADGAIGLIIDARYVYVPAASLSVVNGKLTTSLSKNEVTSLR